MSAKEEQDSSTPLVDSTAVPTKDSAEMEEDESNSSTGLKKQSTRSVNASQRWYNHYQKFSHVSIAPHHKLVSDKQVRAWSLGALRFGIFADALTNAILQPNYAIMALQGADPDSFPNTKPFDFNSATYFVPMAALTGVAIASAFTGQLSDRIGRKPVLQFCMGASVFGNILKWFLRGSFWGFCAASFINGLVSGGLPVALAYIGDVFLDSRVKEKEFGLLVGCFVLGNSAGGIIAILMQNVGLFEPLWVAVAMMAVAFFLITRYLVEPKQLMLMTSATKTESELYDDDDDDDDEAPTTINRKVLYIIIVGALADNVGSNALFPICLSPLAFNHWYTDFLEMGESPVLSLDGYKWMSVLVALMVIPSTFITPAVFKRIGAAGGCVFGNLVTAVVTIVLLQLGSQEPSSGYLGAFIATMYLGFPFTVISQLSTGPMLDRIAPVEKRGYVQGLNTTVMNIGTAVAPWAIGLLADNVGTEVAIWTGVSISFLAAGINFPLVYQPGMGPPAKKDHTELHALDWEDDEIVDKLLQGEYVPGAVLDKVNEQRFRKGLPCLLPAVGTFDDDKERLKKIKKEAADDFRYLIKRQHYYLSELAKSRESGTLAEEVKNYNRAIRISPEQRDKVHQELGLWFSQYLQYAGYFPHTDPALFKHMIVSAFPMLSEGGRLTPDNAEQYLVDLEEVFTRYIEISDDSGGYDLTSLVRGRHTRLSFS